MAEGHELTDQVAGPTILVDAPLVEVRAEVDEAGARVIEEVPDDDEDRALDGDEGFHLAHPLHEPAVTGAQEGVGLRGASGSLSEYVFQVRLPLLVAPPWVFELSSPLSMTREIATTDRSKAAVPDP